MSENFIKSFINYKKMSNCLIDKDQCFKEQATKSFDFILSALINQNLLKIYLNIQAFM